jgi:diphthamide synthase (EF-2-diphthine--ammonia ligase)
MYIYINIYAYINICIYKLRIGGKDSLVAWHIARTQNTDPVLTYVCDDEDEYNDSWRLKEIVRSIGSNVHLVKHIFKNPLFEQHARYESLHI